MESLLETPPSFAKFRARHPVEKCIALSVSQPPFFLSLYEEKKDHIFFLFFLKFLVQTPGKLQSFNNQKFPPRSFFRDNQIKSTVYKPNCQHLEFSRLSPYGQRGERWYVFSRLTSIGSLVCCFLFSWFSIRSIVFYFLFLKTKFPFSQLETIGRHLGHRFVRPVRPSYHVFLSVKMWTKSFPQQTHTHTHTSQVGKLLVGCEGEKKSDWLLKDQFAEEKGSVDSKTIRRVHKRTSKMDCW